ncbi:MAG: hypothetical protein ACLQLC_10685 [Candidatus Sulfotelmatobacter sp.]
MTDQVLMMLRDRTSGVVFGTLFLLFALGAWGVALMRRRSGVGILIWPGALSAIEARPLFPLLDDAGLLPHWLHVTLPYLGNVLSYLVVVVAVLVFLQVSQGKLRVLLQGMTLVGLAIALAGVVFFLFTGSSNNVMPYNHLLAACLLAVLATVVAVPGLSRKFLILPNRVPAVGIFLFAIEGLYGNLSLPLGYQSPPKILDPLGFTVLFFSFGYAAALRLKASLPTAHGGWLTKHRLSAQNPQ